MILEGMISTFLFWSWVSNTPRRIDDIFCKKLKESVYVSKLLIGNLFKSSLMVILDHHWNCGLRIVSKFFCRFFKALCLALPTPRKEETMTSSMKIGKQGWSSIRFRPGDFYCCTLFKIYIQWHVSIFFKVSSVHNHFTWQDLSLFGKLCIFVI